MRKYLHLERMRFLYGVSALTLAFAILLISVLRTFWAPYVKGYESTPSPSPTAVPSLEMPTVEYVLVYPGKILPDNALWYVKVMRDKIMYLTARGDLKKSELALLYADKRLSSGLALLEKGKYDLAVTVLTKGEKYLETAAMNEETARNKGIETKDVLIKLTTAVLKHRQVIETQFLPKTPEDLKPQVVKTEDYSKNTYKYGRDALNGKGIAPPKDPFNGQ